MSSPIRVTVVEDNEVFREALQLLLGARAGIEVVAAVGGAEEAVTFCRDNPPDVVLLDYRLPGIDGVQATIELRDCCPQAAVVCLTAAASRRGCCAQPGPRP